MAACAFCEIARGRDPDELVIARTDHTVAFVPRQPDAPGHTVVIPVAHAESLFDASEATVAHLANAVHQLARAYRERLGAHGVNVLHASGRAAQQSVPHLHIHLIPRFEGDGLDAWPDLGGTDRAPAAIAFHLRERLLGD